MYAETDKLAELFFNFYKHQLSVWVMCIPTYDSKDVDVKATERRFLDRLEEKFTSYDKRWDELSEGQKENFRYWARIGLGIHIEPKPDKL